MFKSLFYFLTIFVLFLLVLVVFKVKNDEGLALNQPNIPQINVPPIVEEPSSPIQEDQDIPEARSFNEAVEIAKNNNRELFLVFGATWCGPCQAMKRESWTNQDVLNRIKDKYVFYYIDVDRERAVSRQHGAGLIPYYGVFNPNGMRPVKVQKGYMSSQDLLEWLF